MANPWTKKNPFMSMWLSGANAVAGRARVQAKRAAKQTQTALARKTASALTKTWTDVLTGGWLASGKPKRRR